MVSRIARPEPALLLVLWASATLMACGRSSPGGPAEGPDGIEQELACAPTVEGEVLILSPRVLEDPLRTRWSGAEDLGASHDGAWSFGRLFADLRGPFDESPSDFLSRWLRHWAVSDTVNGDPVPARTAGLDAHLRDAWPKVRGADGAWEYDLTRAPFRLMAIAHRFDLRDLRPVVPDGPKGELRTPPGAGELRFLFNLVSPSGAPKDFVVIVEYNLPAETEGEIKRWAWAWHDALCGKAVGSPAYNEALADLTVSVTRRNAVPGDWRRPNNSNLLQLRTNDFRTLGATQEFREFRLPVDRQGAHSPSNFYLEKTVNHRHDGSRDPLGEFVASIREALVNERDYRVPQEFGNTVDFQAGRISLDEGRSFWAAGNIDSAAARHRFSLNTCNGCHGRESGISLAQAEPYHVFPRQAGQRARLSAFMTGIQTEDPVEHGTVRRFGELSGRLADFTGFLRRNPR